MSQRAVRIVICEDSPSYAEALTTFLERDPDLRVAGRAASAEQLIRMLPRLRPDLVTMDLELPGLSGPDAVAAVMREHPLPIVVLSAHTPRGSEQAAAALGAGALEAQPKHELRLDAADRAAAVAFRRRLKRLAHARVAGARRGGRPLPPRGYSLRGRTVSVVALCASTGGPSALAEVLGPLPRDYPLPILVVQHITPGFTEPLVRWLHETMDIGVGLARHGTRAKPGVWFAPDRRHLTVARGLQVRLDEGPERSLHRPSANALLCSLGASVGSRAVGVVLTGMGVDGADGVAALCAAGGLAIAQDEDTAAVWGMPRAAAEAGAQLVLPPAEISGVLMALSRAGAAG